jgi:hypothetical protein
MTSIGPIVLFGSGETSPSAHRIHHAAMRRLHAPVHAAILETPAGFQPNSAAVAQSIADYLQQRLGNFQPEVEVVPARRRTGPHSTDDPALAAPIFRANYLFMGPGSPTYAVRHLHGCYVWYSLLAQHRLGAAVCFSSAATIAASRYTLPVYEIYKVGQDLHWQPGLDFLGFFGLSLAIIPHWNNRDGGAALDTSHCYMGQARHQRLVAMLPPGTVILGIEESTGVLIAPHEGICSVVGAGAAIIVREGVQVRHAAGATFSPLELGAWRMPDDAAIKASADLPPAVWQRAQQMARSQRAVAEIPQEVIELVSTREDARRQHDWAVADALRARLDRLGWQVQDTSAGPVVAPAPRAHDP